MMETLPYMVISDGYYESTNSTSTMVVLVGCSRCYTPDTINKEYKGDLYNTTCEHTDQLKRARYLVVEMWECKWLYVSKRCVKRLRQRL